MADFKNIDLRFGVDFEYSIDDGVNWVAGTANTDYTVTPESGGNGKVKVRSINAVTSIPVKVINKTNVKEVNIRNGGSLTTLSSAFSGFTGLEAFRLDNGANIASTVNAFRDTIVLDSEKFHIDPVFTNLSNTSYMFYNSGITFLPNIDLSKVLNCNYMFDGSKLKAIGEISIPLTSSFTNMFKGTSLEVIGSIKINNAQTLTSMFRDNPNLKFIGNLEANKASYIGDIFRDNEKLLVVGLSINKITSGISSNITTVADAFTGCTKLMSPYKLIQNNSSLISTLTWTSIPNETLFPTEIEKTELAIDQTYLSDHSLDYIPFVLELEKSTNTNLIGAISVNPVSGTYYKIDNNQNTRGTIVDGIHNVSFSLNTPEVTTFGTKKVTLYDNGTKSITISGTNIEVFSDATGASSVATVNTTEIVKSVCVNDTEDAIYVLLGTIDTSKTNTLSFNQTIKKYSLPNLTIDAAFGTKTLPNNPLEEVIYAMIGVDSGSLRTVSNRFNIGASNLVSDSTVIKNYSDADLTTLNDTKVYSDSYNLVSNHNIINYGLNLVNTTDGKTLELVIPDRS